MSDFKMLEDENYFQYIWRIDGLIQSGKYKNWKEIAEHVNQELFADDIDKYRDESAYRKSVKYAKDFYEAGVFGTVGEDKYLEELKLKKQELVKEQIKMRDERNELVRVLRENARKESYVDMVKRTICENVEPIEIDYCIPSFDGDNDLLVHMTDIHAGIKIDNWKNVFNEDVLKERIKNYTSYIVGIAERHQSQDCYMIIGEILSGLIHNNLRLQNNMDLMEQFKYVSELLSSMLVELSYNFNNVYVYTTPGNHSRITAKKEDSIDGENMDVLLPFYLKARLQNYNNVNICDNEVEHEIAMFNIRGNNVFSSHGHKDNPASVVQKFTMMFGIKPDIVLLGHRHTNGMTTVYDTKVIESGCVSGSDDYSVSIRKTNRPEQTVSVVNKDGLVCLYDIQLD